MTQNNMLLREELDLNIQNHRPTSENNLWDTLQDAWMNLTTTVLEKLVSKMPRLCKAVIKRNRGSFMKMRFSSHYPIDKHVF